MTSLIHSSTPVDTVSNLRSWIGLIITGLVTLFLAFDSITKIIQVTAVIKASAQLGLPTNSLVALGIVLFVCTTVYVIPQTALLGAILLTGYFGGAVAIQIRTAAGAFPIIFPLVFGALVWLGLILREPRLGWIILLRQ